VCLLCVRQVLLLTVREGFFSSCYIGLAAAAVGAFRKLCLYSMGIVTSFISLLYLCFSLFFVTENVLYHIKGLPTPAL